jgi:hypothetical protein
MTHDETPTPSSSTRRLPARHRRLGALALVAACASLGAGATGRPSADATPDLDGWVEEVHMHGTTRHVALRRADGASRTAAAAARGGVAPAVRAPRADATATTGIVSALVVNVRTSDDRALPREIAETRYREAAALLHEWSDGALTINVEMYGHDVSVAATDLCDYPDLLTATAQVLRVLRSDKVRIDDHRFVSLIIPEPPLGTRMCSYAGKAELGGKMTWNVAQLGFSNPEFQLSVRTIAHEWIHNLGLGHAHALRCTIDGAPVPVAVASAGNNGACSHHEYGSAYSVMGNGWGLTASERREIGWLPPTREAQVERQTLTLGESGEFSLAVARNESGDVFELEYTSGAFGGTSDEVSFWDWVVHDFLKLRRSVATHPGLLVTYRGGEGRARWLLDMNPGTLWVTDAPLRVGQTWTDPTGTLAISVLAIGDASVTVQISATASPMPAPSDLALRANRRGSAATASWRPLASPAGHVSYRLEWSPSCWGRADTHVVETRATRVRLGAVPGYSAVDYCARVAAVIDGVVGDFSPITRPRSLRASTTG